MGRWRRALLLLASILLLALPFDTPAANAKPLRPCPEIHAMGQLYGQVPRGWVCAGRFFDVGNCHRRHSKALFQSYVQD